MNSVKKQFGIILKLAVMLCLIGCFFIGKTSVVKAALGFTNAASGGDIQIKITDAAASTTYDIYIDGVSTKIDSITTTTAGEYTGTLVSKDTILSKVAGETTPSVGEIQIKYSIDGGSTKNNADSVKTEAIYAVEATPGGAYANAEVDTNTGTYLNIGAKAVYGYVGGTVKVKSSNFTTAIFDKWETTTGTKKTETTKEFVYTIASSEATSNKITWKLLTIPAAENIKLNTNPSPYTFDTIAPGNTNFTVAIDAAGGSYDIKDIVWTLDAPSPVSVEKDATGNIRVKDWPSTLYGSYTLTGTLPNSTPGGSLVKSFTLKRKSDLTAVKIAGPTSGYAGGSYTYSVDSTTPTSALIEDYAWYLDSAKVATTPTYTYSSAVAGTHTILLKVNGETVTSTNTITTTIATTPKISDISISPDGVTAGYTATITATVTPKEGVQQFASGGGAKIESSDTEYFTVESYSVDTANGKISIKVKGIKHDTSKKLKFTYQSTKGVGDTVTEFTFKVYMKPKLEESSGSLKITLPDKVITGCSNDLTEVTGFRLYAYKSDIDSPIYDSGDTYKSAGKSKTLSASDVNQIVKDKSGSFSGEQDTLKFVVVPMGKRSGSDDYHRAKTSDDKVIKSDEVSVNVYRASVSGNGIIGSSAYGIAGQKVSITASPAAGYASIKWSDGSTNPTKEVTLSTSTSANQLKAEGVLGAQNPNAAGGTGGANSGDMSGYDDVPKTAESNSAIWLIVFMVFAVLGIAYALYLQLRASTSNDK